MSSFLPTVPRKYIPTPTREDAIKDGVSDRATVEAAAQLSDLVVASGAFVYAGIYAQDYIKRPEAFVRGLEAAARQSQGWMAFDLSQINDYDWWPYLEKAFTKDVIPPHTIPELMSAVRSARDGVNH